jgi:hypothetical protein
VSVDPATTRACAGYPGLRQRVEQAQAALKAGDEAVVAFLRGDLCVCGPMTTSAGYCECGANPDACPCGDPADCAACP